jgi:hypothetical protein
MIVQAVEGAELLGTEVTFKGTPVPSPLSCDCLDVVVSRHCDHWSRNDVVSVELLDHVIDLLSVQTGGGAATGLEAVGKLELAVAYQNGFVLPQDGPETKNSAPAPPRLLTG